MKIYVIDRHNGHHEVEGEDLKIHTEDNKIIRITTVAEHMPGEGPSIGGPRKIVAVFIEPAAVLFSKI